MSWVEVAVCAGQWGLCVWVGFLVGVVACGATAERQERRVWDLVFEGEARLCEARRCIGELRARAEAAEAELALRRRRGGRRKRKSMQRGR